MRLTSGVSVGQDKSARSVGEGIGVPDNLIHEAGQANGITIGAGSGHDQVRECDVILVVGAVNRVASLPAGRKHDLETKAILTVRIEVLLVGHVVAVESSLWFPCIVQAVETESTLGEGVLISLTKSLPRRLLWIRLARVTRRVGSSCVCARQHSEVGREGGHIVAIQEVVAKSN